MPDKVRIPVEVTGDEAAKQKLGDVGKAASAASTDHAGAQQKVAKGAQEAAGATRVFEGAAVGAAQRLASMVNPALGQLVGLIAGVGRGIAGAGRALLGWGALIAVVSGLLKVFADLVAQAQRAEEAIRRVGEARREQAETGLTMREKLEKGLAAAGFAPTPTLVDAAMTQLHKLMQRRTPGDIAVAGVIGELAGGLSEQQREQLMGGVAISGKAPTFRGRPAAVEREIQRFVGWGASDAAQLFLASFRAGAAGERAVREAPPGEALGLDATEKLETAIARLRAERPWLSERDIEVGRAIVSGRARPGQYMSWLDRILQRPAGEAMATGGGTVPIGDVTRFLRGSMYTREQQPGFQEPQQPTVVNQTTYNIATAWMGQPRQSFVQNWEQSGD
jgi:hypothetical protein